MNPEAERQLDQFMTALAIRNPHQEEFVQVVREVMASVIPFTLEHPRYAEQALLERLSEPDRTITFRVVWEDDAGRVRMNRAWRVQFNNAVGPYKGGLRFRPSVDVSVLKFLAFEQIFKNSLTGLPLGGGKGGSNFDPKGHSTREVMRFCQSLMTELFRHLGEDTDIPAGDIGVGEREIGFLFGQYKRLANRYVGTLTGKGLSLGGSPLRKQATGYGVVYFMQHMLGHFGESLEFKRCSVSGSGNVALHCIEKLMELGATVVTASDTGGTVFIESGFDDAKLNRLKALKEQDRARISQFAAEFDDVVYLPNKTPWHIPVELAFPCATQNELTGVDAQTLVDNGLIAVAEGANMPCTTEAQQLFCRANVRYAPGKAANAGGVAVSALEQTQNAAHTVWTPEVVNQRLHTIMHGIHTRCLEYGTESHGAVVDYVKGANLAGFVKVADAMLSFGVI